jgi:hypothetical protein
VQTWNATGAIPSRSFLADYGSEQATAPIRKKRATGGAALFQFRFP